MEEEQRLEGGGIGMETRGPVGQAREPLEPREPLERSRNSGTPTASAQRDSFSMAASRASPGSRQGSTAEGEVGAADRIRTDDINLGKVALYH